MRFVLRGQMLDLFRDALALGVSQKYADGDMTAEERSQFRALADEVELSDKVELEVNE